MNLARLFLPKNSRHCIICSGRFPTACSSVSNEKLCICEHCYQQINAYKSPSSFDGGKYITALLAAYPYEGVLKNAFIQYKFSAQREYHTIFSELLVRYLTCFSPESDYDLIVPVPLSNKRLNERGFNQSALIAQALSARLAIEYSDMALFRTRHTKRQSSLNMAARTNNVRGAFLSDKKIVTDRSVLLVDDIFTIGATMNECAKTLLSSGAKKVSGITLFKSVMPENKSNEYDFGRFSTKVKK